MSFVEKLFQSLSAEEDEVVIKQMWDLYGPLLHWSMIFPRYKPGSLLLTLVLWLFYVTFFSVHFVLMSWSIVLELETLELWGLIFNFQLLMTFAALSLISLNVNRTGVAANHRRIYGDIGSYPGGRIYSEEEPMRLKKLVDRETLVFLVLPLFIVITSGAVLFVPYIAKLGSDAEPYSKNGLNVKLPVPAYYPFPTHEGILHLTALLLELVTASLLVILIMAILLVFIKFSQRMKYEYRVLGYALRTLFPKAAELYRIDHPGASKIKTLDPVYQKYVGLILRGCVIHHLKIVESLGSFYNAVVKWPAAFCYGCGVGAMGLSLVTIVSALEANDYQSVILFSMVGLAEVMGQFLLSLVGETITSESQNLRDQLYDIDWYNLDLRNRKTMLNFQAGITEPYIMRAGGVVDICLDTFSSLMNSTYSFFNLMNVGLDGS